MTTREIRFTLRAMAHCTCRIDAHCLRELERLQTALVVSGGYVGAPGGLLRLQVLRALRVVQRCPCYFATHCIETLCDLADRLSFALRSERKDLRKAV